MAAKKGKGFGDIWKGLKKNPALLIAGIVGLIIIFVLISNSQANASGASANNSGLPNGTGGSSYYIVGAGDEYATGGPWDSFFKKHPASYHNKKHSTSGKSHKSHSSGSHKKSKVSKKG